jgi:ribonucleoside-diphosphate reductase beta chain
MSVFDQRVAFKPFEYPECEKYSTAISHSFWLVSEWSFTSDVQDFHTALTEVERSAIKNTLLAISQIEVSVKKFWSRLGDRFPKPEFEIVGITFGESEVRHSAAYSHLLQVLGLNDDFTMLLQEPVIQGRVDYLTKYLKGASGSSNENYTLTLALFSLFVEATSLFGQFYIIRKFAASQNRLKDIDNVVQATQLEEVVHSLFGAFLLNLIKKEYPEWFNDSFYGKLARAAKKAYEAEERIVDWIFSAGELSFLPKDEVKSFLQHRFNEGLALIGAKPVFTISPKDEQKFEWFNNVLHNGVAVDFFHQKSVNYSKNMQSFTENDLF